MSYEVESYKVIKFIFILYIITQKTIKNLVDFVFSPLDKIQKREYNTLLVL